MIQILPLYDTSAVIRNWKILSEGMQVLHSDKINTGSESLETTFNKIMSGQVLMHLVFFEGKYIGFFITQIRTAPTDFKKELVLYAVYAKEQNIEKKLFGKRGGFLEMIEEMARKYKCDRVVLYSKRRGMERLVKPLGYEVKEVCFAKEVS